MALTNKQRVFVESYLVCWNATEAAKQSGYSTKTAYAQGARLLKNAEIQTAIAARIEELKAGADEVVLRLASHSRGTMDDFLIGENLSVEQARERGKMHLVKKYKVTRRIDPKHDKDKEPDIIETVEFELYDAQAATVQLGRALGLFVDKVAPTDPSGKREYAGLTDDERSQRIAALLERARARRDGQPDNNNGDAEALDTPAGAADPGL